MSGGHRGDLSNNACQTGPMCFFTNSLMGDAESDWSPIHDAAFNGRLLSLQRLIAQGACVNLSTLDHVSPLHGACMQGHEACARLLLEKGADANPLTVNGNTPLSEACAQGHLACVSLLLQHGAPPVGNSQSGSPIHRAAAKGHTECIETLVQHGADVNQHIDQSGPPLYTACSNHHLMAVRKLLQLGATVNRGMADDSPLHVAARLSSPEIASLLIEHGADRFLKNSEGKRPLDLASLNSVMERLLGQAGVPCLMQLCRGFIRKTVGKDRFEGIRGLHIPKELKDYLLYLPDSKQLN